MKPSVRDSNRTQADFLRIIAQKAVAAGQTEPEFIKQFRPQYQPLASRIYLEVKS
jgi:hypothetical protein